MCGDEHPLWGVPVKSAVGPPGFGAQPGRFHKLLTPPLPHPCQRLLSSIFSAIDLCLTSFFILMVTKTIQEYTLSICTH